MTAGLVNGTLLLVYSGLVAIAHATSHSLSMSSDLREATTKESEGWADKLEGLRSWSISGDGLYAVEAGAGNFSEILFDAYNTRTPLTVRFTTDVTGDKIYSGEAYITSLELSAGTEETATYSFSFEGTGVLAETEVPV